MKWKRKRSGFTATGNNGAMARIKEVYATEHRETPKQYFRLSVCLTKGAWQHIKYRGKDYATLAGAKSRAEKMLTS